MEVEECLEEDKSVPKTKVSTGASKFASNEVPPSTSAPPSSNLFPSAPGSSLISDPLGEDNHAPKPRSVSDMEMAVLQVNRVTATGYS